MHDFGRAELFDAEAIGQPGNRRFRIFARSPYGSATLWMEREQLEALSLAVDKLLAQVSGGDILRPEAMANIPTPPGAPSDFPETPLLEFQVANMQLGYDEDRGFVLVRAAPLELVEREGELMVSEDVEMLFSIFISRSQALRLSQHIVSILATGRPRCPFCGRPMDTAHVCEKQNGFHPAALN